MERKHSLDKTWSLVCQLTLGDGLDNLLSDGRLVCDNSSVGGRGGGAVRRCSLRLCGLGSLGVDNGLTEHAFGNGRRVNGCSGGCGSGGGLDRRDGRWGVLNFRHVSWQTVNRERVGRFCCLCELRSMD